MKSLKDLMEVERSLVTSSFRFVLTFLLGFVVILTQNSCVSKQPKLDKQNVSGDPTAVSRDIASSNPWSDSGERMRRALGLNQAPADEMLPNFCKASGRLMGLNEECPVFSGKCRVGDLSCHQREEELFFLKLGQQIGEIQSKAHRGLSGPLARAFHKKSHACLKALVYPVKSSAIIHPGFDVHEGIFKSGLPREYKAWVRFSNASSFSEPDGKNGELRGMALKVMTGGVGGTRLTLNADLPQEKQTQDFLATNKPRSTAQSAEEFIKTGQANVEGQRATVQYFFNFMNPHVAEGVELLKRSSPLLHPVLSVALEDYWSGAPYRLGRNQAVKFNFTPCRVAGQLTNQQLREISQPQFKDRFPEKLKNANYLRENLKDLLGPSGENICFELRYQFQTDPALQPIENAFIEWSELAAPSQIAAKILIPPQDFDSLVKSEFCEALDFSPWNGTVEHQPIGETNRARKIAYGMSQRARHESGHLVVQEPSEDDWNNWDQR